MIDAEPALENKICRLKEVLRAAGDFVLAVSGGLDSRFLCRFSQLNGCTPRLAFFRGPHLSPGEQREALAWIKGRNLTFEVIESNPLGIPEVAVNGVRRCYWCKRSMFAALLPLKERYLCKEIFDGSNASDLLVYRPGLQALDELGVKSPLALAGMDKGEIRRLARGIALDRPDQPSRPCLLTRFAYDFAPDEDALRRVGLAEDEISALGFSLFRLRLLPDGARLQLARSEEALFKNKKLLLDNLLQRQQFWPYAVIFDERLSGFFDRQAQ